MVNRALSPKGRGEKKFRVPSLKVLHSSILKYSGCSLKELGYKENKS